MRAAPRKIPAILPDITESATTIRKRVVQRPDVRLTDSSIEQLVMELGDETPIYLTGSNVWLRAVFGGVPGCPKTCKGARGCVCSELDYDILFSSRESSEAFICKLIPFLNSRIPVGSPGFKRVKNSFGSARIVMPDETPIMDIWCLEEGESIAELLMGYPADYQRCAYHINTSPSPANLIRVVRPAMRCFPKRRKSYPGRDLDLDDSDLDLKDAENNPGMVEKVRNRRYPGR